MSAVIFDMDGLLLDTEQVCLDCFVETRRAFSLSDSPDVFLRCVGLRNDEGAAIIRENLLNRIDTQTFNEEWGKRIDARLDDGIPLKNGAKQLIQILALKGISMGVATSTRTSRARIHLEKCGLLGYFKCVIGGDLVENGKPHPEVYCKAAEHLGENITDCVVFEDSEVGTRAAVAAGAQTVQIPDLVAPSDDFAKFGHVIASDLIEGALMMNLITEADV